MALAKLEQQVALLQRRNADLEDHFRKALAERDRVRKDLEREQVITAQVRKQCMRASCDSTGVVVFLACLCLLSCPFAAVTVALW